MKLIYTLLLVCLFSCVENINDKKNDDSFYYVSTNHDINYKSDTLTIEKIKRHNSEDIILEQFGFKHNNVQHIINMFTNYPYAPIDGGQIFYELDSLGIIYSKSTTWDSYIRLKSSNDSLNNLIEISLENIKMSDKLNSFDLKTLEPKENSIKL